jgi:hypothetical protein
MASHQKTRNGAVWIEGPLTAPPEGINMPLVIGREWLLEMVRTENGAHVRYLLGVMCDIREVRKLNRTLKGRFVGFSVGSKPPQIIVDAHIIVIRVLGGLPTWPCKEGKSTVETPNSQPVVDSK